MTEWVSSLRGLPLPVGILVVFTICMMGMLKAVFKHVVTPLPKSQRETSETIRRGLDENTAAAKKAVEHNEKIIENHLSHNGELWWEVQREIRAVSNGLSVMNSRHRKYDKEGE